MCFRVIYRLPKQRRDTEMTRFERDLQTAKTDLQELDFILRKRRAELDEIWKKGKCEKNGFRRQCLAQEYERLEEQYNILSEYI